MIDEIYNNTEAKMIKASEYCAHELSQIRTGRASTNILDNIKIDYYGTPTPLKNIAHVSTPDPQLLLVQPFDPTLGTVKELLMLQLLMTARILTRHSSCESPKQCESPNQKTKRQRTIILGNITNTKDS